MLFRGASRWNHSSPVNICFVLVTGITFAGGTRVGVVFSSNDGHLGSRWREGSHSRTSVNGDRSTCRVQEAKGKSVLFGHTNQLCSTTDLIPCEQLRAWLNESSSPSRKQLFRV